MIKPKRIAHFIETELAGGAEQVMLDLCEYCNNNAKELGLSAVVFHFDHPWIKEQCDQRGIENYVIPFQPLFKSNLTLPLFAFKFKALLRSKNIDLLHSHLFGPIVGGSLTAFLARIPHVGTLHDVYMIEEAPKRIHQLNLAGILGTEFITVSKQMESFYRGHGKLMRSHIQTIYNGIAIPSAKVRQKQTEEKVIFGCVGRLIPLKQVDQIVKAFYETCRQHANCELWVIGEGEEESKLIELASNIPRDQIHFLGRREDVTDLLQKIDVFVQYSTTEGLSRSIIEALAATLPAIVSDVGGNRELVSDHQNGILVDPNNVETLEQAMKYFLETPESITQMGEKSHQHCVREFGLETFHGQYLQLYKKSLI